MSAGQLRRHEIGKVTALTNPLSGHGAAVKAAHGAIARLKHRGWTSSRSSAGTPTTHAICSPRQSQKALTR